MKRICNCFYSLALVVSVVFISCKKDNGHLPPPVQENFGVFTTGTLFNSSTNKYEPFYWINEERFALDVDGSAQGFPYGIEKLGNDVYIAGGYQGIHPVSGDLILMPCYWKNGSKINLPVDGLSFDERCGASDLKWHNGALYILGDAEFMPVIWKVTTEGHVEIIKMPLDKSVTDIRKGSNLELYNNKIYFACSEKREDNGQSFFNAGYWEMTVDDKPSFHVIEDKLAYALCFGISVSSKGVFIPGEYSISSGDKVKPMIWTLQGHHPVSDQMNANYHRLHEAVVDDAGNLYVNVFDIQNYRPLVWKIQANGNSYVPIKPEVPADAKGFCQNLSSADNKVAHTYLYELSNGHHYAATIFDGKKIVIDLNNSVYPFLHSTRIFKTESDRSGLTATENRL